MRIRMRHERTEAAGAGLAAKATEAARALVVARVRVEVMVRVGVMVMVLAMGGVDAAEATVGVEVIAVRLELIMARVEMRVEVIGVEVMEGPRAVLPAF